MKKIKVANGLYWVEEPEADLRVLCGCPADSIKHLMRKGLIVQQELDGVICETGPNAILLSDLPLQQESFANLAEFPVLQMLYRQGMIIPDHPGNTGEKPLLIGIEDQVLAQAEYIYRGNYGLDSKDRIMAAGISEGLAENLMRMKIRFSFGKIMKTDELLDLRIVEHGRTEIKNGVYIERKDSNVYEFSYDGETFEVDLNLKRGEIYEASYNLGHHMIEREYFSVVHIGEGDGWDINRPCMASLITYQGKIYLIDAGPNIVHSLTSLGISTNEIEGIFHTHAHDDHFNGLTVLMRGDHRIKYYSSPLVRASVERKLGALLSFDHDDFKKNFEVHDLELDEWNNIDGLEVKPVLSPHPVETNIMFFRVLWEEGYKTYAHLADIAAFDVLDSMVIDDPDAQGISREYCEEVKQTYLTPVHLKKIDIGGGMIHGKAIDFVKDQSDKILLSHTAEPLTDKQKEIGASTSFGMADVLVKANQDFTKSLAYKNLRKYFPDVPHHELRLLLNCPVVSFNPGSFILRKGDIPEKMFFLLSGIVEHIAVEHGIHNYLSAGTIVGEIAALSFTQLRGTYRAVSFTQMLEVPCSMYLEFASRNNILDDIKQNLEMRRFLQSTWLIGDNISCPVKSQIVRAATEVEFGTNQVLEPDENGELFIVHNGGIDIFMDDEKIDVLGPGGVFGEEKVLFGEMEKLSARTITESCILQIPSHAFAGIPIIRWKLLELYEKRTKRWRYE